MTNALATSDGIPAHLLAALTALAQDQEDAPSKVFTAYMKFDGGTGLATYGADDTPIPHGTRLVADAASFRRGWLALPTDDMMVAGEKRPLFEEEYAMTEPFPAVNTLPPMPAGVEYAMTRGVDFRMADGTTLKLSKSSGGVKTAIMNLRDAIIAHVQSGMGGLEGVHPVVEFITRSYPHKIKRFGVIHNPVFKVVGWQFEF